MSKRRPRNRRIEEASIRAGIVADPDPFVPTDAELARMRPAAEVVPDIVAAHRRRIRGRQKRPTKVPVSWRIEAKVLDRLRAGGSGWQTRANEMLRRALFDRTKGRPRA